MIATAERRFERAQDVPIAISAFSEADLEKRGVTTNDGSQNRSSPIAMYVDDVYRSVGAVQALQTYDLDRVEVLRSPHCTLYGKNATGGAMNFHSRNPNLTATDRYIAAGVGKYNSRTVTDAAGAPIVEKEPKSPSGTEAAAGG